MVEKGGGKNQVYSEFLRQLLEAEQHSRWERKLQRRRRWSKLGPPRSLEGFDWAARPQLPPQVIKELLTCRFIDEHRNIILVGRPSTGKTTVAKALGHAACSHALSVYYAPTAEVLGTLHAARADDTYRKVFRRVTTADLLILDDAGFSDLGRDAANELFRVVCARYRQRSTIVYVMWNLSLVRISSISSILKSSDLCLRSPRAAREYTRR